MGMSFIQLEGWTTKQEVKLLEYPNTSKAEGAPEKVTFAFLTLMVKRDYQQVVKDANGAIVYGNDGKPKKEYASDAIKLKFRNGAAKAIVENKLKDQSRHLWISGTLSTYDTQETYVMVEQPDKKLKQVDLFASADGKKVPLKHVVHNFVIEVNEFKFLDANPNQKAVVSNTSVTIDDGGIIVGDEDIAYTEVASSSSVGAFTPYAMDEELPF